MKIRYFVIKGKSELSSIYVRFWDSNRIDQKSRTGLTVKFSEWSETKEQVKISVSTPQKDFINSKLRNLENYLLEEYNIDYNTQQNINSVWLKEKIKKFFGRADKDELYKIYFTDWVKKFIDDSPQRLYKGNPISPRTIQHHTTAKNKLINYERHSRKRLRFQDINLEFYRDFLFYCRNFEKLNDNTFGTQIAILKTWCKNIEIEGLSISQEYKHSEFRVLTSLTKDVYLTEKEINAVCCYDFSYSERLDNVRDNFIFGLRTGLRISDFLKLEKFNFIGDFIEIITQKTAHPVVIPMHQQIKAILEKRKGNLPAQISDQKFNEYVKEVCKVVGFTEMIEGAKMVNKKEEKGFFPDEAILSKNKNRKETGRYPKYELITSHTCRRSFASNLYGKLPNMTIMAITGHKTETQFLKYIKITPRENAEKLKEHWENENNS
ncbi:phage integrase SAM-like domain-containing protein [Flavobacterium sp. Fl-318]|uniref:Phage integrase SAM-like domain-containing protein n=1 Tax=Flavobacterium cupriresistens TaxID=2893885 RepID=A0ABU4RFV8_9FLAO|nr:MULTISPECIES: phage integrase SAM-like domain-containing protein [unclassified Flavobacterium]MDX6190554.1 phage integrase SAM-like domain-containing protein [Flavobacterium sp. Fl-318]UFH43614.1 site-specific integrase [Flavobacterium sp. F-323]